MSGLERRESLRRIALLSLVATVLIHLLAPSPRAEPLLLLQQPSPAPAVPHQGGAKRQLTVGLNENGDLVVRNSDLAVILAYAPPADLVEPGERLRVSQKQELPAITGISLKVSFLF